MLSARTSRTRSTGQNTTARYCPPGSDARSARLGVESRIAQAFAQMRQILGVQELVAVVGSVEHRIGPADVFAHPRRVSDAAGLCIGGRQHRLVEAGTRISAQVELRLL